MSELDKTLEILDRAFGPDEPEIPLGRLPEDHSWQLVPCPPDGELEWVAKPIPKLTTFIIDENLDVEEYRYFRGLASEYKADK